MKTEENLKIALFRHVEEWANNRNPQMPIDAENAGFDKPNNAYYIEVRHFPNVNPGDPTWGDEQLKEGFLQVGIVDPMNKGTIAPARIADEILTLFAKGTRLTEDNVTVKIEKHPNLLTVVQDGQRAIFPVSIPYRAYVNF